MAGYGGAREGAGRKPTAQKFESKVAIAERKIANRMPELVENMLTLARGVTVQETDKEGNERTYTKPPDYKANEYLLNRIMGKPTERVESSGPGGGAIVITLPALQEAAAELDEWRKSQTEAIPESERPSS